MLTLGAINVSAQMYSPAASALTAGTAGQVYAGQTISFTVPAEITINTSIFGDPLVIPGLPFPIPNPNQDLSAQVVSTVLSVTGLPPGLTFACSVGNCTYNAGATGSITISGTPTQADNYTIDITSLTNGSANVPQLGVTPFPQPVPTALDEPGYSMAVANPASVQELGPLSELNVFADVASGQVTLSGISKSPMSLVANITDIQGRRITTRNIIINEGVNRVNFDLGTISNGIYVLQLQGEGVSASVKFVL